MRAARHPHDDPLPTLRAEWQAHHQKLLYDHCHYTPYGYEIVAKETVDWLDAQKLIPPAGK
jgi:hypothetical protein